MEDAAGSYLPGTVIPAVLDGGTWAACFGLSWTDMLLFDQAGQQRIIRPGGQFIRKMAGTMGVAAGRNEIARHFLTTDAEWLFMVDSDMGFAPDTPLRLMARANNMECKIMGALCFAQKVDPDLAAGSFSAVRYRIEPTIYRYAEVESTGERGFTTVNRYQRDAVQMVSATGAACMLVHRDAFIEVGTDPFMPITDPHGGGNGTSRTFSEDLSFCVRAAAADLEIGVDTSVKTTHYKGGVYLDETTYAMQQETLIQAKGHEIARLATWAARQQSGPFGLSHAGSDRRTGGDRKDEA